MCKRYTTEAMWTRTGELESIQDLRVHSEMFPTVPENIYRACLAGVRRQRYWWLKNKIILQKLNVK